MRRLPRAMFFFFNDTATTEIYTLSLHDALPISFDIGFIAEEVAILGVSFSLAPSRASLIIAVASGLCGRSEEHTSELQSRLHLVCRLLLEKKKPLADERFEARPHPRDQLRLTDA